MKKINGKMKLKEIIWNVVLEFKSMTDKLRNMVNKMRSFKNKNPYRHSKKKCHWKLVIFEEILAEQFLELLSGMNLCVFL